MAVDPTHANPIDKYKRGAAKAPTPDERSKGPIPLEGEAATASESPAPDSIPEPEQHTCYAAFSDGLAYTVDYVFLNGSRRAFAYGYVVEVRFDPSNGIDVIYTGPSVKIEGRNLLPVYDALRTQRAYRIVEVDGRFGLNDADTAVTRITVTEESQQESGRGNGTG